MELPIRFTNKYKINEETGCWEWTASRTGPGYGQYSVEGKPRLAHRIAYQILIGPVPEGLELDHLCRVRHCCNPSHLEAVSHKVNSLRGEGVAAQNAVKTHCIRGHELSGASLYVYSDGKRGCRTCNTDKHRAYRARKQIQQGAKCPTTK